MRWTPRRLAVAAAVRALQWVAGSRDAHTLLRARMHRGRAGKGLRAAPTDRPVRRMPITKTEKRSETLKESVAGIWQVIRTPSIGRVFFIQLTSYPSYLLIVGLWGGPYLTHIYGYDLKGRGEILFIAALAPDAYHSAEIHDLG